MLEKYFVKPQTVDRVRRAGSARRSNGMWSGCAGGSTRPAPCGIGCRSWWSLVSSLVLAVRIHWRTYPFTSIRSLRGGLRSNTVGILVVTTIGWAGRCAARSSSYWSWSSPASAAAVGRIGGLIYHHHVYTDRR